MKKLLHALATLAVLALLAIGIVTHGLAVWRFTRTEI